MSSKKPVHPDAQKSPQITNLTGGTSDVYSLEDICNQLERLQRKLFKQKFSTFEIHGYTDNENLW